MRVFFFLNGMNVSGMPRRVRKKRGSGGWQEGGGGVEPFAWRSAGEGPKRSLQTFGNPSFINVKPSSAERRLTDITELLHNSSLGLSYMQIYFTESRPGQ